MNDQVSSSLPDKALNLTVRHFLSKRGCSTTSSVYGFIGVSDSREEIDAFLEISSCHKKIKIHKQDNESWSDYQTRLSDLREYLHYYIEGVESYLKIILELPEENS